MVLAPFDDAACSFFGAHGGAGGVFTVSIAGCQVASSDCSAALWKGATMYIAVGVDPELEIREDGLGARIGGTNGGFRGFGGALFTGAGRCQL